MKGWWDMVQISRKIAGALPVYGLILTILGVVGALTLMISAWVVYPGGYDWLHRDLSTLGRVFTVNGLGRHENFSIYNFGLLLWGMSAVTFFAARGLMQKNAKGMIRTVIGGVIIGLGVIGIGITPADVLNNFWHSISSTIAILTLVWVVVKFPQRAEPGKKIWLTIFSILALWYIVGKLVPALSGGSNLCQKFFVLSIYTYMVIQSLIILAQMKRRSLPVKRKIAIKALRLAPKILLAGCAGLIMLIALAITVYPGGFDWQTQWTSKLGDIFLRGMAETKEGLYSRFMIYNYALSIGGVAIAAFWFLRSMLCRNRLLVLLFMIVGVAMGASLVGIGMAPTQALGLHRLSINIFSLSVGLMLLIVLLKDAGDRSPIGVRWGWAILIIGSAILFAASRAIDARLEQKIMIFEVWLWLICQGWFCYSALTSNSKKRKKRGRRK